MNYREHLHQNLISVSKKSLISASLRDNRPFRFCDLTLNNLRRFEKNEILRQDIDDREQLTTSREKTRAQLLNTRDTFLHKIAVIRKKYVIAETNKQPFSKLQCIEKKAEIPLHTMVPGIDQKKSDIPTAQLKFETLAMVYQRNASTCTRMVCKIGILRSWSLCLSCTSLSSCCQNGNFDGEVADVSEAGKLLLTRRGDAVILTAAAEAVTCTGLVSVFVIRQTSSSMSESNTSALVIALWSRMQWEFGLWSLLI
ncbi:hypothetical protein CEXT_509641 [Caerostris extrusa]|uniref:Uncharacterized protein n=1 Tax=Caerostris extrusa TaxID=172846 RepID=A0AAV4PTQ5_CAEEX|nr:hypothetical protein CEXT_509641 [Caerostris extrusa]